MIRFFIRRAAFASLAAAAVVFSWKAADSPAAEASAPAWTVNYDKSELTFTAYQSGSPVTGRFETWTADIRFSPDNLKGSRVRVEVDTTSVASGDGERDSTIRSDQLLHADQHPTAVYEADGFRHGDNGRFVADGELTIRGMTNPQPLSFSLSIGPHPEKDGHLLAVAEGGTELMRLSYGVGKGDWKDTSMVPNRVEVAFTVRASRPEGE